MRWYRWVHVWDGTFGPYGDNRFCSKNCAYWWAVKHSRPRGPEKGLL